MNYSINRTLDLTNEVCPWTFVYTKLELEEMSPGEILLVVLKGEVAITNVPRSVKSEGHKVLEIKKEGDIYSLIIQRGEDLF